MFDSAKFGAFVAKLRKSADMTQSELGDRLGLTRQAVSRYECGDSFPDISVLREIAATFQIPLILLINSGDPTEGEAEIIDAVAAGRDIVPKNPDDVVNLAPFLKPSVLTKLSESMAKQGIDMSQIVSLAEYLNESDTKKLMKDVSFDSIAEMDMTLLERLMPLLGPYATDVIFQKIIDGELDYQYLELLGGYSNSLIEAAVVYGVLETDALSIMYRNNYNRYRMENHGVIKLFTCSECGKPLTHFYPRRCKCGLQPNITDNILRLAENPPVYELIPDNTDIKFINNRFGDDLLVLVLGAANISGQLDWYGERGQVEFIILDGEISRLYEAEKKIRMKRYSQILFALDDLAAPHIMHGNFDLIIDNTAGKIGDRKNLLALLKKGGCLLRGGSIVCEV